MSQQTNLNEAQGRINVPVRNPATSTAKGQSAGLSYESFDLVQALEAARNKAKTLDELLIDIASLVSSNTENLAIWIGQHEDANDVRFGRVHAVSTDGSPTLWQIVESTAQQMMTVSASTREIKLSTVPNHPTHTLITAPVLLSRQNEDDTDNLTLAPVRLVLCGCFSNENESQTRQQWMMGIASTTISGWSQQQSLSQVELKTKGLNDAIGLVQALDKTTTVGAAGLTIVNHLRRLTNVKQVSFSYCHRPGNGQLLAVSDIEKVDLKSEANRAIENANHQAISLGQSIVFPTPEGESTANALALEKYCRSNQLPAGINIPIQNEDGKTIGSLLFGGDKKRITSPAFKDYLQRLTQIIGGHLDVVVRANRGLRDLAKHRIMSLKDAKWAKPAAIIAALLFGAMLVPWPYRVACDCEVQPVMRRFIAAPYDGILEKPLVTQGDIVKKDQVLATLDGRSLRIELAGVNAERAGAKKRRDSALARGDVAESQIARSEMRRHDAKIDLLTNQLVNLEVRSPIDGIIVSGDLDQVEGAPLEMGKTLFEVGPLNEMLAEVSIPESEIQYVETGMTVAIKLNAFPFKNWEGTIEKIHPSTEIVNDKAVFMAQVKLQNESAQLRPGMQGGAKVSTAARPIGWNLFHRAWEKARYWLIW